MADNTLVGVGAIVAIVVVAALFFSVATPAPTTAGEAKNIAGQAYTSGAQDTGESCEPDRFCDGSKLVIVREDCSLATAWCDNGCDKQALVCR